MAPGTSADTPILRFGLRQHVGIRGRQPGLCTKLQQLIYFARSATFRFRTVVIRLQWRNMANGIARAQPSAM